MTENLPVVRQKALTFDHFATMHKALEGNYSFFSNFKYLTVTDIFYFFYYWEKNKTTFVDTR